jgi:diguanylate cyclase (GGDEF)-like protein
MMLLLGPEAAALINFATTVITPIILRKKRSLLPTVFSGSQFILCIFAAHSLYVALGGSPMLTSTNITGYSIFLIVPATLLFFVFNHIFVDLFFFFRGDPLTYKDYLIQASTDALVYGISTPFAILILFLSNHVLFLFLIILPLALFAQMFKMYERLKRLNRVHRMVSDIQQEFNPEQIFSTVANTAIEILKCPAVIVWMKTEDRDCLVPKVVLPQSINSYIPASLSLDQGLVGAAVSSGTTLILNEAWKDTRAVKVKAPFHFESLLVVPLKIRSKSMGAIVCYGIQKRGFSGEDQNIVEFIAAQTAVYIENAQIHAELREMSIRDSNTGLYNTRFLHQELSDRLNESRRRGTPLSLVLLDIDFFKNLNDTYGHLAGDMVLRQVGRIMEDTVKGHGIATRYGGEEFTLLLNCPFEKAFELAESIRLKVAALHIPYNETVLKGITISAGIAAFPDHAGEEKELIERADQALYWGAKRRGRNKVAVYSPSLEIEQHLSD